MAAESITAANVTASTKNGQISGKLAVTVTGGQVVIQKSADSLWYLGDANGGTSEYGGSTAIGVAMGGGTAGVYISILTAGSYTTGSSTLVAGKFYYVSETAGGIEGIVPATTGSYSTLLGMATSTTALTLAPNVTGQTVA